MTDKKNGASSRDGGGDAAAEQGFDRWLNRQLHRLYDPVLAEAVPDEILRLLHQFDDQPSRSGLTVDPPANAGKRERR